MIILGYEIKKYITPEVKQEGIDKDKLFKHNLHFPEYKDNDGKLHLHQTYGVVECDHHGCVPVPFKILESGAIVNESTLFS